MVFEMEALLLSYAVSIGMVASNPAVGIKRYSSPNPDGIHTWIEDEAKQYLARHSFGTKAHLAMQLGLCSAQRLSDVVRMGWQHIRGNKITVRQDKTTTPLIIPIHSRLGASISSDITN